MRRAGWRDGSGGDGFDERPAARSELEPGADPGVPPV